MNRNTVFKRRFLSGVNSVLLLEKYDEKISKILKNCLTTDVSCVIMSKFAAASEMYLVN